MKIFIISLALFATVVFGKETCLMTDEEIMDEKSNHLKECYKQYNMTKNISDERCSTFCFARAAKIMEHDGTVSTNVLRDIAFPEDKFKPYKVACDSKFDDDSKAQKYYPCDYTYCLLAEGFFDELSKTHNIENYKQNNFRKDCN